MSAPPPRTATFHLSPILLVALAAAACSPGSTPEAAGPTPPTAPAARLGPIDPPSGPGAMAPNLALAGGEVLLTWLEPDDPETREAFRLRASRWNGAGWSEPVDAAAGSSFFANWADFPAAAEAADGSLVIHWLEKLGEETYAYGVALAASGDGGATWERRGWLHDDASPTEHGFVSFVSMTDGVRAFWLDGRAMAAEPPGAMQLRTALLTGGGEAPPSPLLDDRVCECCQTDAALTARGPIVVYRDRSDAEVRDVSVIRAEGDGWSEPRALFADGWEIHGCPVNGPLTVDGGEPVGRVDVALDPEGRAWVSWMATAGEGGEVRLRRFASSGEAGAVEVVAETTARRSAGVPRMIAAGDRLVLVWVEDAKPSRLAMAARPFG